MPAPGSQLVAPAKFVPRRQAAVVPVQITEMSGLLPRGNDGMNGVGSLQSVHVCFVGMMTKVSARQFFRLSTRSP